MPPRRALLQIPRATWVSPVGPSRDAYLVPRAVGQNPSRRGLVVLDDASTGGESRRDASFDLLAGNRDVHMHGVPQGLVRAEFLHPHRRTVTKRIDRVVGGQRRITQDSAPETHVRGVGLGGDRDLDFLHGSAVRDSPMRPRGCRDGAGDIDVRLLQSKHATAQPNGEAIVSDRQQNSGPLEARYARDRLGQPRRVAERPDTEHSSGTAMQHHPVPDALRSEKLSPAILAHACLPILRRSPDMQVSMLETGRAVIGMTLKGGGQRGDVTQVVNRAALPIGTKAMDQR